ncbi:MAG TPA: polysaccharide deacetylase family protein [Oscillospiraceae bacterium]|nr:polysaccharide deacetylase family protein [Oscillospiraceae bacterium]HPF56358.1 polysaccharide deacetylase family protein [Clostridiales bacterium]HPK34672.1 polysaccharide deacetylase family protein [Oscillospiraceae bacterium]HPR74564.1 polysaccharide deacetylase family protein [Oscillospiraceae bacterium]
MFDGKKKAVTFSYDDGVTQDIRLIELFNKYGLKATFNLNSGLLGKEGRVKNSMGEAIHNKVQAADVASIYRGHEVAVHTVSHPNLTGLEKPDIIRQVEDDRRALEDAVGYEIVGMAYPCGGVNNNDFVASVIAENTPLKYARTITCNDSFERQNNLYRFQPTVYHMDFDKMFESARDFVEGEWPDDRIFYVWGHSYEFDYNDTWGKFKELCEYISGRADIFYGTNCEVLLNA